VASRRREVMVLVRVRGHLSSHAQSKRQRKRVDTEKKCYQGRRAGKAREICRQGRAVGQGGGMRLRLKHTSPAGEANKPPIDTNYEKISKEGKLRSITNPLGKRL